MPEQLIKPNLVRRVYPNVRLTPGLAVDIAPGVGFDMNDPLYPHAVPGPFQLPEGAEFTLATLPADNDLVKSSALLSESTNFRHEASRLAVGFAAKFALVDGSSAYATAREELAEKTIFYLDIEVVGGGSALPPDAIGWSSPPSSDLRP